ncbi:MAG: tetratricopeptide repeat protein [Actinomycetota bacterium]
MAPGTPDLSVLPTGTVTFLMTDIEGSTSLWEAHPAAMRKVVSRHDEIAQAAISETGGQRPKDQGEGDSILCAFARATDALACAVQFQRALAHEPWPEDIELRVRMAVHTGEIELRDESNYFGPALNRAARLRAIGHGGQVLVSQATSEVVGDRLPGGSHLKDLGMHLLKDLASKERVYQLVHPDLLEKFPSLNSLESLPNNLPVQLTSFVGREQEMIDLKKILSNSRMVTLTGAAGCGKTRLAVHAAADLLDSESQGVWFVDLAPVSDPALVAQSAAHALGLRQSGSMIETGESPNDNRDSAKRLADHIRSKSTVMVLDNCEHLISACAELSHMLLHSCTNLRIVATSREPLGVAGETSFRVPSLSTPDPDHMPAVHEMSSYQAVLLFEDRAAQVQSDFVVSADNAPAIAQICRRLEGIPLAIELAAAQVTALTPQQIAARLDDTFRLLIGGSRTALERQQTLRAAVDWSYRLLNDQERLLLARLSVFAGGFTLEAAEAVCAGGGLNAQEILQHLTNLVSKSLVQKDTIGSAARFKLLETIRQYGREKAYESEGAEALRIAHRDYYLSVAEQAWEEELPGAAVGESLKVLESEHDNIRAAFEWSLGEADPTPALLLAADLLHFWSISGYLSEGASWLDQALSKPGEPLPEVRARALAARSWLALLTGDLRMTSELAGECLEISTATGFKWGIAAAQRDRALVALYEGDMTKARLLLAENLVLAREIDNLFLQGTTLGGLIQVALATGDRATAHLLAEEGLGLSRKQKGAVATTRFTYILAFLAHEDGDFKKEHDLLEEGLAIAREIGDRQGMRLLLAQRVPLARMRGDHESAASSWAEAVSIVRDSGEVAWLTGLANAALANQDYDEARAIAEECLTIYREISGDLTTAAALGLTGGIAYYQGDLPAARALWEECVSMVRPTDNRRLAAAFIHGLGETARAQNDLVAAGPLLGESLAISRELGIPILIAGPLASLGLLARAEGNTLQADSLLREALTLVRDAGLRPQIPESLELLAGLAADKGELERAARLFGAAETMRQTAHSSIPPVSRGDYDNDVALLHNGLDEALFDKAWHEGKAMTIDEAVEFALGPSTNLRSQEVDSGTE